MDNLNSKRWWDWSAVLLLAVILFSSSGRLAATNSTEQLSRVEYLVMIGLIAGLALGKSRLGSKTSFWFAAVYGIFFIPWQVGQVLGPVEDWRIRLFEVGRRIGVTMGQVLYNQPVTDNLFFLTLMCLLFWILAVAGAYGLVRHGKPWVGVAGSALVVVLIEAQPFPFKGDWLGWICLAAVLLLVGRLYYLNSRKQWDEAGGLVDLELGFDLGRGALATTLVLMLLIWNMGAVVGAVLEVRPEPEQLSKTWLDIRERLSNMVSGLRSPQTLPVEDFGDALALGVGGDLGNEAIMNVLVEDGFLINGRYYWRAHTYDTYLAGGRWQTTLFNTLKIGPGESPFVYPETPYAQELGFIFRPQRGALRTLYHVQNTISVNRDAVAVYQATEADGADINAIKVDPPLAAGDEYRVRARLLVPTLRALRDAGTVYPERVTEVYLQLPEDLDPRFATLANVITEGATTPYDQVAAITNYLRSNMKYSKTITNMPDGVDPLEYFLFTGKEGFCNYYATAEIVMLRTLGIPARLVVGYAEGAFEEGRYVISESDSHAWPEVYFPGLGWIEFEPTVSQPATAFPAGDENPNQERQDNVPFDPITDPIDRGELREDQMEEDPALSAAEQEDQMRVVLIVSGGFIFTGLGLGLWYFRDRLPKVPNMPRLLERNLEKRGLRTPKWVRNWARRAELTPLEKHFTVISQMIWLAGGQANPADTPAEQVERLYRLVPETQEPAKELLFWYHAAEYGPYEADLNLTWKLSVAVRVAAIKGRVRQILPG